MTGMVSGFVNMGQNWRETVSQARLADRTIMPPFAGRR
jgi:hypothetical protein